MLVSKGRRSVSAHGDRANLTQSSKSITTVPELESLVESRDYSGALALLQFKHQADAKDVKTLEWLGYCYFHNGDYEKALDTYQQLQSSQPDPMYYIYQAACLYYLDFYKEAEEAALKGPRCAIQSRILFHIAHRLNDEKKLVEYHGKIGDGDEDQLSLASMHFGQMHYEEATEIYKQFLLENKDWMALNVYLALCYYNLDHYDVSLEVLNGYLQVHPESAIAANLKACNTFQLFNGKAAELVLTASEESAKNTLEQGLFKHNLVVFRNGEGALQVLPPLLDVLLEARLNLVIHYLRIGELNQAYESIKIHEPNTPQEYVVKAVACASLGQETEQAELLSMARQYFHLIGNFAKARAGDSEELLLLVRSNKFSDDYYYVTWLLYCMIMNGKASVAWEHVLRLETSDETFSLLQLIANECYKTGQYLYAAKAFDAIERLDEAVDCWEGKRGACLGVFQKVITGEEEPEHLKEVFLMLESSSHSQVEFLLRVLQDWMKETSIMNLD